jgi:hypothetical protein
MALAAGAGAAAAGDAPQPLQVSADGRRLETFAGAPFFWMGDTAWRLYRLDPREVDQYMADRAARGFTVIQGPVLLPGPGQLDHAGQESADPAAPNPAWFAHVDAIVEAAADAGLHVAPALTWGDNAELFDAPSAMAFGAYVGARYGGCAQVAAFILAGEFNHPADNPDIWEALAAGLAAAAPQRLLTIHPKWFGGFGGQTSSAVFHDAPWLDFNMIQSGQYGDCTNDPGHPRYLGVHNWLLAEHDHGLEPAKPLIDAEATYEMWLPGGPPGCAQPQPRWDAFGVRRRAYWSVFAGAMGHTYGANGVWQFHQADDPAPVGSPLHFWDEAMAYPGASQMGYLRALMESRPADGRIPGQHLLASDPDPDVPHHAHALADERGRYAMVYVPQPGRTIGVDVTWLGAAAGVAWWFHPADGSATLLGGFGPEDPVPGGTLWFTTPAQGEDWVLVLDDAAQRFGPPGAAPAPPAPPGDANGDGLVNVQDLVMVQLAWGSNPGSPADLDGDGVVGIGDIALILAGWTG